MIVSRSQNQFSQHRENSASLLWRFFLYQKERFPLLGHGLLVAAFSFSAVSYSRICRGATGFIDWPTFSVGIFTTISLFFLVRVFDEFKDAEEDARYRPELPVPRGLVSLRELAVAGTVLSVLLMGLNLYFFPKMLSILGIIMGYLLFMGKEFFVARWLKSHQFWYVTSHMFIIPFIDVYASGLDWLLAGVSPPTGLLFFFAVSYMNGIVLEIGRKIRVPAAETAGVLTYSAMLGTNRATGLWIVLLFLTLVFSMTAALAAGYERVELTVLAALFVLCTAPAFLFLTYKRKTYAKMIEYASAIWTVGMYLTLGGGPMLAKLFME